MSEPLSFLRALLPFPERKSTAIFKIFSFGFVILKKDLNPPDMVNVHSLDAEFEALAWAFVVAHVNGAYFQSELLVLRFVIAPICMYTSDDGA